MLSTDVSTDFQTRLPLEGIESTPTWSGSTSLMMASFIEFEAAYSTKPISGENQPVKEPFYLTDKSQVSYEQLLSDPAGINPRIESVLKMAARRLTNKVAYNIQ